MTKAEELKILEAIEGLILEAGPDSYIRMTFAGVPEICRRNIEDDFGNIPVQDLEEERKRHEKDNAEIGAKLLRLEHENQALQTHLDEVTEKLEKYKDICHNQSGKIAEMQESIDACGDCMMDNEKHIAELEAEIVRLKAEIVRMRMERMTDADMEKLYDKMKE